MMPSDKTSRGLARKVGDVADEFLERLLLSEQESHGAYAGTYTEGAHSLWGCDYHFCGELVEALEPGSRYYLVADAQETAAMHWPVDFAMAVETDDGNFFLSRVATLQPKDVRGIATIVPAKCAALVGGYLTKDPWFAETSICGLVGNTWRPIESRVVRQRISSINGDQLMKCRGFSATLLGEIQSSLKILFAAMLTARYSWHAAIGFSEDGPRLVLPTNPQGALDLFRSRMLAPGEKRRAALRHWVNSHYRDRSDDPGIIDYVREHLRGSTRFIWNGLDCELMVSAYDLEKNEAFRVEAEKWRAQRQHNRVRLRVKARA